MSALIRSQFVDVDNRRVFLRHAGRGPAVLLLHQSPQSSRALIPWIDRLSAQYAVFAPDTPGFGFSDPLPLLQPTIPDFAAALKRLLDVLGIERVIVYGVHTGAVTALRLSLDFPERIAGLVCDGYARFNADERQKLLNGYLPPFEPEWDGGHLLWLWARIREQSLYFPWHTPVAAARMAYPAPSVEKIHSDVMDVLDAGESYRSGYRAPFLYDDPTAASRLRVESRIYYRTEDVLASHFPRLFNLPAHVEASRIDGGQAGLAAACDGFIADRASQAAVVDTEAAVASAASLTRRQFATANGELACWLLANGGSANDVFLHLHDIGQPPRLPIDVPHGLMIVAPELPGHGASPVWLDGRMTSTYIADAICVALQSLGATRVSIRAEGGSAAIAANVAKKLGNQCRQVTFANPLPLTPDERSQFLSQLPDLSLHSTGAHVIAAWNWARMKHLFWPWLQPTAAAARKIDAPAPKRIHDEVLQMMRCGTHFADLWANALSIDLSAALSALACDINITCEDEPERQRLARRLADSLALGEPAPFIPGVLQWQKQSQKLS